MSLESQLRPIDEMLDVSRVQSGKLSIRPRPTELSGLLRRVAGDLEQRAAGAGSTIVLRAMPEMRGIWDEFRIEQILINLLTNAIRYGKGRPIEVSCMLAQGMTHIQVADHGIGISKEDRLRIFAPFERALPKDASGGLRLGLFIAKQLAEAHGGTIDVESSLGEGATFTLRLPCEPVPLQTQSD